MSARRPSAKNLIDGIGILQTSVMLWYTMYVRLGYFVAAQQLSEHGGGIMSHGMFYAQTYIFIIYFTL